MKVTKLLLCGTLLLCSQLTYAFNLEYSRDEKKCGVSCNNPCFRNNWCQLGTAGFNTMNPAEWYEIITLSYPTTTPLSLNRNRGSTQGNIQLNPTGLTINQAGNYSVTVTAILTNNDPFNTPLIPLFLIRNGIFDPLSTSELGAVGTVSFGDIVTLQSTGILEYVDAGTSLSIVATNGGNPDPVPITVIGWGISAFRIPCAPTPELIVQDIIN